MIQINNVFIHKLSKLIVEFCHENTYHLNDFEFTHHEELGIAVVDPHTSECGRYHIEDPVAYYGEEFMKNWVQEAVKLITNDTEEL